jgi:hypothetical protein
MPTLRYYHSLRKNCEKKEEDGDFSCFDPCKAQKMVEYEEYISLEGLKRRGGRKLSHAS